MDERLKITDSPRPVAGGVTAETPPVTLAWRALRAEYQHRVEQHRRRETEARLVRDTLASVAEEAYRLRRVAERAPSTSDDNAAQRRQLLSLARRLIETLEHAGVQIVAPEGQPYTTELMDLLDNTAQRPDAQTKTPRVFEVVTPAVTYRGELLRMGRAVIAVPAGDAETVTEEESESEASAENGADESASNES